MNKSTWIAINIANIFFILSPCNAPQLQSVRLPEHCQHDVLDMPFIFSFGSFQFSTEDDSASETFWLGATCFGIVGRHRGADPFELVKHLQKRL